MNKDINILAIETSCDETSVAIVMNGRHILSNIISSQIDIHKKYGGVVPEIASRKHIEIIDYVIDDALKEANFNLNDIDAIAVTYGPGLVGALLVGVAEAKALSFACNKPLIGVHHIEGHINANYIENDFEPPFICLVVSGGHSHIIYVSDYNKYEIMGHTRDDAVGEAYDKVARAIGYGYPGGPIIDNLAKQGNPYAIDFPRIYLDENTFDFSFSGLKSSVLNYINKSKMNNKQIIPQDIAASFQQAVVEVLVNKTIKAAKSKNIQKIAMAGGVASNSALRKLMEQECINNNLSLNYPLPILCTDNAAMIGAAAYYEYINGNISNLELNAVPNLKLGEK